MLNLVLADNLFQVFVSWELVGICSYLLVGFYFERHERLERGQQGVHHQPRRRRRLHHRPADPLDLRRHASTSRRSSPQVALADRRRARHELGSWPARSSREPTATPATAEPTVHAGHAEARAARSSCSRASRSDSTSTASASARSARTCDCPATQSGDDSTARCPTGCWSSPGSASSSAASASRRSSRCTSGCPTRWKARRRSAP